MFDEEFERKIDDGLSQIKRESGSGKLELKDNQWGEVYKKIYGLSSGSFFILSDKVKSYIGLKCSEITSFYGREAGKEALCIILSEFLFNILNNGDKNSYFELKNSLLKEIGELELDVNYLEGVCSNGRFLIKGNIKRDIKRKKV